MAAPDLNLRTFHPPQEGIPRTRSLRDCLRTATRDYVTRNQTTPPLSMDELRVHADALHGEMQWDRSHRDFTALLLSNAAWRDTVAAIPYHKRLLLLPRCLRHLQKCPARCDEVGLLCEHCGSCAIDPFKRQAEDLGYAVLIAEGSPVVMGLIETGQIEAVIGVSCLSTLERVYPYMEAGAVPGIAIPLLYDGCENTTVDTDWVWEALYESTEERCARLDLEALRKRVSSWFTPEAVTRCFGPSAGETERLALSWVTGAGKRWRPLLTAATAEALGRQPAGLDPCTVQQAALAVECFHKASLIHDDIEDGDARRYGQPTLHTQHGIPIALNVGDLLLGEGYRLLAEAELPAPIQTGLIAAAAQGHRTLCLGQGRELIWARAPHVLNPDEVLSIFRDKTAPAFAVALLVGAILAEADETTLQALRDYSTALGIAYQIRDDLDDLIADDHDPRQILRRPSILPALIHARANPADRQRVCAAVDGSLAEDRALAEIRDLIRRYSSEREAADLLESYKARAIAALGRLTSTPLKSLLRRVLSRIFFDLEVMGCCDDPQG